jgi:3-dehydroquinate synthase
MRVLWVPLGERSYPIYIGSNLGAELKKNWRENLPPCRLLLVSDERVFPLHGDKLLSYLNLAGYQVAWEVLPAGETGKTLQYAEQLYTSAIRAGLDRHSAVVAFGGGVSGDLAGFVAATYLRGVPFVQVPTTLLAQVDSSVGGKVAVNHPLGKNLIGAFYQPRLVWIDLAVLETLPYREYLAGAAEVIKYAIILSEEFCAFLEDNWQPFLDREPEVLAEVVATCCALKSRVVAADEREEGLRAILNFGHTLGHALEAATDFSFYLHGEAVLAGMLMATKIAEAKGVLPPAEAERQLSLYRRLGVLAAPSELDEEKLFAALWQDKKRQGERLVFVLPRRCGEVELFSDVSLELVRRTVREYLSQKESSPVEKTQHREWS